MVNTCCVHNCTERRDVGSDTSFHMFPRNPIMRDRWIKALCFGNFVPTRYVKVCSKHFTPDSYTTNPWSLKKYLKKDAVPNICNFPKNLMPGTVPRSSPASRLKPQNTEVENADKSEINTVTTNDKVSIEPPVEEKRASYIADFQKLSSSTENSRYQRMMKKVLTKKQEQIIKLQQHNKRLLKKVSKLGTLLKHLKHQQVIDNNHSLELPSIIPVTKNATESNEFDDEILDSINLSCDSESNILFEKSVSSKEESTNCISEEKDDIELKNEILEQSNTHDCDHENMKKYLAQLTIIKQKWEEIKLRKDSLQKELNNSYTDESIERLSKILGGKEKNLEEFQDYLEQNNIVITQLKDQDIILLYENRNITSMHNKLPDLIDESPSLCSLDNNNLFDCDYCPQTFFTRSTLEVHLKSHDYKIFYFCEDCGSEFLDNEAKEAHDITCIKKIICRYCDFMLNTQAKKQQHEQNHCDTIFGQLCEICGEKFKYQGTLNQHIKTQHISCENVYECAKCPEKFANKQKLNSHVKSVHTISQTYLCEDCGADFKTSASFRHHRMRNHQSINNERECPVCHKLLPFYSLSKHMNVHKERTIKCPDCEKMFKNSWSLKQHIKIHEDLRQYLCDTCGVGFNRRAGLRLHMKVHEKTNNRPSKEYSCQICLEKFPNQSLLVIHWNRLHRDGKQYICQVCNKSMLSTRSLEHHILQFHSETLKTNTLDDTGNSVEMKRLSCDYCEKTFKTEKILRTHIKNVHLDKNSLECLDCDVIFASEDQLKHHMVIVHNRLKGTIKCPHCPKRCINRLQFQTHMISHSEEQSYSCELDGSNSKTKIQLMKHRNKHSDQRPLQCRYCEWRCKQISALVYHERSHINEQPYSCTICEKRFKYLSDKNKHEKKHESLGDSGFKSIVGDSNVKNFENHDKDISESKNDLSKQEYQAIDDRLTEQHVEYDSQYDREPFIRLEEQGIDNEKQHIQQEIVKEINEETDDENKKEYNYEIGTYNEVEDTNLAHQQWQEETKIETDNNYKEEYRHDGIPGEPSEPSEVFISMEDETVYTEEVTTDNIESAEMITDQTSQTETVVHIQQNHAGKIQIIPLMLSLNRQIQLPK